MRKDEIVQMMIMYEEDHENIEIEERDDGFPAIFTSLLKNSVQAGN